MKTELMFTALAAATVASPGPGVLMTLTNTVQHGIGRALPGIFGIAMGSVATAALSASGVGLMMSASPTAFAVMRYAGACYLAYLGWRLWCTRSGPPRPVSSKGKHARVWWEGVTLQFTNPKSLLFFLSVLPQFIDPGRGRAAQLLSLVFIYSLLVVLIHGGYALMARKAQPWLAQPGSRMLTSRISGSCFIFFGVMLALAPPAA